MKLVDLNVLLYVINEDAPQHATIIKWWESSVNGADPLGLAWVVIIGFLRITTNPRIFFKPLDHEQALEKINTWLALDNVRVITEQKDHWLILRSLVTDAGTAGNLTTDAHLASLAITHGATLVSCDSDFARFKGLRWENPSS